MDSTALYFLLLWPALLVVWMLYTSRKATVALEEVEAKNPGLLANLIYYASKWVTVFLLAGFVGSLLFGFLTSWPPRWLERRHQRNEVFARVEKAGGWKKLVEDTQILLATNQSPGVRISPRYDTNFTLPPAIASLKARDVELEMWRNPASATFQIYGYHSTGARGQSYYWLCVVPEAADETVTANLRARVGPKRTIRQITNSVFEIY